MLPDRGTPTDGATVGQHDRAPGLRTDSPVVPSAPSGRSNGRETGWLQPLFFESEPTATAVGGERQRFARHAFRRGPVRVGIRLIVLIAGDVRPAIVPTCSNHIDFIVGVRAVLGLVQLAVRGEGQPLRIAMAVRVDMASHAGDDRVPWNTPEFSGISFVELTAAHLQLGGGDALGATAAGWRSAGAGGRRSWDLRSGR